MSPSASDVPDSVGKTSVGKDANVKRLQPHRSDVNPSQWGVAALAVSEPFKTQNHKHKPAALRWDHRLSTESASREGCTLKAAFKHLQKPGIISLGGGIPLSEYIPFESLGHSVVPLDNSEGAAKPVELHSNKGDMSSGKSIYDLTVALNYCQGSGSAQLLRWITEHAELVHNPPYADWQCSMSIGNTSALDIALRMFAERGDYVLSDDYTFSSAVETALPMGVRFMGVKMDAEGLIPQSLHDTLQNWDPAAHGGSRKPFLLYTVPTGQNPTGATQSLQRRKDIYRVAQKHDLIILEDDPYYYIQMDKFASAENSQIETRFNSPESLLGMLIPTYLSIDTDGRVVRMDSFSKVVSPGLRVGWVTASEQIIERYKIHADVSTQGPSGFSQLALFKLLDEHWGHSGFLQWLLHIRQEYSARRTFLANACDRHLPKDIVSWNVAEAGMFQWLKVDWRKHPDAETKSAAEIEEEIWLESIGEGVLVARGSWFEATANKEYPDVFYRITFAAAPLDKIEEAVTRLGEALKRSFKLE
ncbi:pyridoxal phosphate-dependent transferase [Ilyonectria robusta]|uniref:pyridoxal phosphate-dependent transferase n=1 Tax=Ilyonectria robusta TaxID=1079257 RepID=UPI001E8CF954|nr:pyridoxal phosphate-dependent transferase [Ilyonectria robusta]KAH8667898.1 pyridoxal phosphate-dependent transferase [Ilyonectria robusta]